jgi:hypothetical protein
MIVLSRRLRVGLRALNRSSAILARRRPFIQDHEPAPVVRGFVAFERTFLDPRLREGDAVLESTASNPSCREKPIPECIQRRRESRTQTVRSDRSTELALARTQFPTRDNPVQTCTAHAAFIQRQPVTSPTTHA